MSGRRPRPRQLIPPLAALVASLVAGAALAVEPRSDAEGVTPQDLRSQIDALRRDNQRLKDENDRLKRAGSARPKAQAAAAPDASGMTSGERGFREAVKAYNRERGYDHEERASAKAAPSAEAKRQRLFLRADSIDNYLYGLTPASKAKGASLSFKRDHETDIDTVTIDGMVSYLLGDPDGEDADGRDTFLSGWAFAPYVEAHGNLTKPQSPSERSSLKTGFEAQYEISSTTAPIARQVFTFAPYYQTDFRGEAEIIGANAYWDPFDPKLHLGGYVSKPDASLSWFVRLRAEADLRKVSDPGLTALDDRDYAWLGGTARLQAFLFPSRTDVPSWITNRLSLIASASLFADAKSGRDVQKYVATLKYNLDPDGYSSLAAEYAYGTDKDTLTKVDQYLLKLLVTY